MPSTWGRVGALGSSSTTLRLPNRKQVVKDCVLEAWDSSQSTGCSNGWRKHQNTIHHGILTLNCYDMACVIPRFIIYFHLKIIIGTILLKICILIARTLIYLQSACCKVFGFCFALFLLNYKRTQNRRQ